MKVIIAGAGELGYYLAKTLSESNHKVLLVDVDRGLIDEVDEELDVMTVRGNVTHRRLLKDIGCAEADLFMALTGDDAINVVSASWAKKLGAKISLAKVDDPDYYPNESHIINDEFGIDATICSSRILALEFLRKILLIGAEEVYEFAGYGMSVMHLTVGENSNLTDMPLKQLEKSQNCRIVGLFRNKLFRERSSIQKIMVGDQLAVAGSIIDLFQYMRSLEKDTDHRKAVVVGGGDVGLQLAKYLELGEETIELIEIQKKRCIELAGILKSVRVIHGNGSDLSLLKELRAQSSDYVAMATGSDEANIMCCLIAKEASVGYSFARLSQAEYTDVVEHLNIDSLAFAHNAVLQLALGFLDTATTSKYISTGFSHDYYELRVPAVKKTSFRLSELNLPSLVHLIGVVRNFILIDSDSAIKADDHLVFAGPKNSAKAVIKAIRQLCRET
ncbi:MAG: NAD-binding protein [Pseudobacteriovorax sp.]|nr:NAD-binding protein [Pseudobacteriovorax sp.]